MSPSPHQAGQRSASARGNADVQTEVRLGHAARIGGDAEPDRVHEASGWSAVAPAELRAKAMDVWLSAIGLRTAPLRQRTTAERLADLEERVLADLGETGKRLVDEERNRP